MIRTESEYQEARQRLQEQANRLKEQHKQLEGMNLSKEEMKRVLDPARSFHEQLKEEVTVYERLERGEFEALHNFEGLERWLVALRIAKGLTQRELAERLGRDERNDKAAPQKRGFSASRGNEASCKDCHWPWPGPGPVLINLA